MTFRATASLPTPLRSLNPPNVPMLIQKILKTISTVFRGVLVLYDTSFSNIPNINQFVLANRANFLPFLRCNLQLTITANPEPSSNMKPLLSLIITTMIQLIPSSSKSVNDKGICIKNYGLYLHIS